MTDSLSPMTTAPAAPFGRLLTAMATPFHADGTLDLDSVQRVAKHLVANGNDGLVVSGTTGESPTTTTAEDGEVLAAVRDAVGPDVPLVAGVGTNDTRTSIQLARQARERGADAVLLVTPYYNRPTQRGLIEHFRQVTEAAELPVMLYDVPGRTGTTIGLEVYQEAITWDAVVAVKDAVGTMPRAARLAQMGYAVYSGDDVNTLGFLAHGACGLVSVVAHAAGPQLASMIGDFLAGDHAAALATYRGLLPVFDGMMGVPNYGATTAKGALQLLGVLEHRGVRPPLAELDSAEYDALRAALAASGLLVGASA